MESKERGMDQQMENAYTIGVLVSSRREWAATLNYLRRTHEDCTPYLYGEYLKYDYHGYRCVFFYTQNRKTRSAAATQYLIDRFNFSLIIVIGTCAGIDRSLQCLDIVIPNRAVNYDMSTPGYGPIIQENDWTVYFDLSKLDFVYHTGTIATGERVIVSREDYEMLNTAGVTVGDTESAAIAYVCRKNQVDNYFIKGISDFPMGIPKGTEGELMLSENGMGEDQSSLFSRNVPIIMNNILENYLHRMLKCLIN